MLSNPRKFEPKLAALAQGGFNTNFATHPLGGLLDNSQSNPSAVIILMRVHPLKNSENSPMVFNRDADPVVFKAKAKAVFRFLSPHANARMMARLDELDGIGQQI
jgi:hypothetical protein